MSKTTQEWQQLLDGTPPAPWKAYALERHPNSDTYIVGADGRRVASSDRSDAAVPHESTDLVTAAPEAVAEVVRLREELEALRRACIESAEEAERNAEVAYIPDPYVAVEEAERDTADIITRILNGDTDE